MLLTLFVTVVTGAEYNQSCRANASADLVRNVPCHDATTSLKETFAANLSVTNTVDLNAYCARDCRAINNRLAACPAAESVGNNSTLSTQGNFSDATRVICTIDRDNVSCYDVNRKSKHTAIQILIGPIISACIFEIQSKYQGTCSPGCAMALHDFLNNTDCCYVESLVESSDNPILPKLILLCGDANNDYAIYRCQVIPGNEPTTDLPTTDLPTTDLPTADGVNGATNRLSVIYGSALLIAGIIVSVF